MYFGKKFDSFTCSPITLNDSPLEFVSEWKYLGVLLKSDSRFNCSAKKCRTAFFRSSNSILNVLNRPSETVKMKLLYSVCIPIITYGIPSRSCKRRNQKNIFLQQMGKHKMLRESLAYLSVTEIFANRKRSFESRLSHIGNSALSFLYKLQPLNVLLLKQQFIVACCY